MSDDARRGVPQARKRAEEGCSRQMLPHHTEDILEYGLVDDGRAKDSRDGMGWDGLQEMRSKRIICTGNQHS